MFKKILIANRGEIAVRVIKACREMKIISAAVYSDADQNALHVRAADEAYHIGKSPANESYLNQEKIIKVAKEIGADAIHPGYGFLSENAGFIKMVEDSGLVFIGPPSSAVKVMGEKTAARRLMAASNVPIVPGTTSPIKSIEEGKKTAAEIGYPIMLKASAGGGGKGMRRIDKEDEFETAFERASNEALKAFGNNDIYLEKFINNPKHIEVQIIGDKHGNYFHLFERECSVQRRHQKIIEEAPSISVDEKTRQGITSAAIEVGRACGYFNAGTVEFLMDDKKNYYFLEMNTRLQVEHPVTEMITGIDLVKVQFKVAAGQKLTLEQDKIIIHGAAIECRVYAEDVDNNFAPSIGIIKHHRLPSGPGVRVDRGIDLQTDVSVYYDPLLSKVVTWGSDRDEAIQRMKLALGEYQIAGVITNMHACKWVISNKKFLDGTFNINFMDEEFMPLVPGKWKGQNDEEIRKVIAVFSALLKSREAELSPLGLNHNSGNGWSIKNGE